MVEEFVRGREYLGRPAFAGNQQLQRLAYGAVIVGDEDDWYDMQHGRSPQFTVMCAHDLILNRARLMDDAPTLPRF